jgi:hypothetical protein
MSVTTYYVTFGAQYPRELHPTFPLADHDGWVAMTYAHDETEAWEVADAMFGRDGYSTIYPEGDPGQPTLELYPRGQLAELDVTEVLNLDADEPETAQPDPSCILCGGQDTPCPACNPRTRMEP